jgi:GNAT superfamily N-acetyltransferase
MTHVCKDGSVENDEWIQIYQRSFPDDERQSLDEIKLLLSEGSMELDETRDENDRILCMTITEIFRPRHHHLPFLLACYTAVEPEYRGLGIGSFHRTKLDELLKAEYSRYIGIITEIESTKVQGLPADVMDMRQRRKRFFLKLGLQPIESVDYYFPSIIPGDAPIAGELLWVPFEDGATLSRDNICDILERIYIDGYGLRADDPIIGKLLSQFSH